MNTKEKYCEILGTKEFPKSPQQLPREFYLPGEALGDLEKAIFRTQRTRLEYSQGTGWHSIRFLVEPSIEGTENDTGNLLLNTFRLFLPFGKNLCAYHTHYAESDDRSSYEFSSYDVASIRAYPRCEFISLCGTIEGVAALLQTEQSAGLPLSSTLELRRIEKKIDDLDFEVISQAKQARILEELGFGYYKWTPRGKKIKQGGLLFGINFSRIYP